jgi:PEP-CTERM motif
MSFVYLVEIRGKAKKVTSLMNHILIKARKLAILGVAFIVGGVSVPRTEAGTVYAFAEQKVYDMTLSSATPANMTGNPFSIRTSTASTLQGYAGVSNNTPVLDATQSFSGNIVPPSENLSGAAPYGTGDTTVLVQANATSAGLQNATDPSIPGLGEFSATNVFTRSDVITRIPNAGSPAALDANYLFTPGYASGNVSVDSAAEGLGNLPPGSVGSATSNWTISGSFTLSVADTVSLSFNLIDRLVAFSNVSGQVADASLGFSLDIKDNISQSVFSNQPSYNRQLAYPLVGQGTRNDNKTTATSTMNTISFVSPMIDAGTYTFSIQGSTTINVTVVPEPSSYVMMGLGLVTVGGLRFRRKMLMNIQASA